MQLKRHISIVLLILFLGSSLAWAQNSTLHIRVQEGELEKVSINLPVSVISAFLPLLADKVGHLRGDHILDLLDQEPEVTLGVIFGSEHGLYGQASAGAKIEDSVDGGTGVKVYSLYGQTRKPTPDQLRGSVAGAGVGNTREFTLVRAGSELELEARITTEPPKP